VSKEGNIKVLLCTPCRSVGGLEVQLHYAQRSGQLHTPAVLAQGKEPLVSI